MAKGVRTAEIFVFLLAIIVLSFLFLEKEFSITGKFVYGISDKEPFVKDFIDFIKYEYWPFSLRIINTALDYLKNNLAVVYIASGACAFLLLLYLSKSYIPVIHNSYQIKKESFKLNREKKLRERQLKEAMRKLDQEQKRIEKLAAKEARQKQKEDKKKAEELEKAGKIKEKKLAEKRMLKEKEALRQKRIQEKEELKQKAMQAKKEELRLKNLEKARKARQKKLEQKKLEKLKQEEKKKQLEEQRLKNLEKGRKAREIKLAEKRRLKEKEELKKQKHLEKIEKQKRKMKELEKQKQIQDQKEFEGSTHSREFKLRDIQKLNSEKVLFVRGIKEEKAKQTEEKQPDPENRLKNKALLDNFLKSAIKKGRSKEEIEHSLVSAGWPKGYIQKYCAAYLAANREIAEESAEEQRYKKFEAELEKLSRELGNLENGR
jgi:hypothetical protein